MGCGLLRYNEDGGEGCTLDVEGTYAGNLLWCWDWEKELALFKCSLYFGSFGRLRSNIFFSSFVFKKRKHANLVAAFVEIII